MIPGLFLWLLLRALEISILYWPGMRASVDPFRWDVMVLDSICTLAFSYLLIQALKQLQGTIRLAGVLLVSFGLALLLTSSALIFQEFGEFVSPEILLPLAEDPSGAPSYIYGYIKTGVWALLLPAWGVFAASIHLLTRQKTAPGLEVRVPPRWARKTVVPGVLLVLVGISMNGVRLHARGAFMQMESSFFRALLEVNGMGRGRPLHYSPHRLAVRDSGVKSPYSVVVILGESWGAEELAFFPSQNPSRRSAIQFSMPELEAWLRSQENQLIMFPHAFSNSADTKVSVPSAMTGVSPDRPIREFHSAPFLWNWAQAYGLQSFYVTSQRYRWSGFFEFFRRGFPGEFFSAEDSNAPLVNDIGIDDSISAGKFDEILSRMPQDSAFLAVYNPNALHGPYQQDSHLLEGVDTKGMDRLAIAHLIADRAIANVLDSLRRNNRLERTFLIFTGDHGNGVSERRGEARLFNYRDGVIRVPWMVRVPKTWKTAHPDLFATARANRLTPIANIDLVPTVLHILATNSNREPSHMGNSQALALLSGQSVFSPLASAKRTIVSLVPIRKKAGTRFGAFSLIRDNHRLIYSSQYGFDLFDIRSDPELAIDLWNQPESEDIQLSLLNEALKRKELKRIMTRGRSEFLQDPAVLRAMNPEFEIQDE